MQIDRWEKYKKNNDIIRGPAVCRGIGKKVTTVVHNYWTPDDMPLPLYVMFVSLTVSCC